MEKGKRKLIDLPADTIKALQVLANKDNRSLKNYIELVLIKHGKTVK